MKGYIFVELFEKRIKSFLSVSGAGPERLHLTTVKDLQNSGMIKLYFCPEEEWEFCSDEERVLIKEIIIDEIPQVKSGTVAIDLLGRIENRVTLLLTVLLDGEPCQEIAVDLSSLSKSPSLKYFIIPPLLIFLLLILYLLFLKSYFQSTPAAITPGPPVPTATAEEKIIPAFTPVLIYFNPESAKLSFGAKEKLENLLTVLKVRSSGTLYITGYCALYGSERGREKLSLQRALNVETYLINSSWKTEKKAEVRGLGGRNPVTTDRTKQHLNRRVEIGFLFD
ncbi:MAG TPA: OmpA family protein [Spirochaetales bacterium]|nr:OmpA family protein [Spirochaetales bacterium]